MSQMLDVNFCTGFSILVKENDGGSCTQIYT